jgi:sialic acid synthase SpsE
MLNSKNMRRIRPGYGLPPKMYYQLIGKKVNKNIKAGTALVKKLINLK